MKNYIGTKVGENEFKLSRIEAERVYFKDHRAKGEFIVRELPARPNTRGDHGYKLATGALLIRVSKRGFRPYLVHGEGALEALKV
jgi:hypothetical protein